MADGQIVSTNFGPRPRVTLPGGLHKKARLHPGAEPGLGTSLAALLTRNAMLKRALDQERAAAADMRRTLSANESGLPGVPKATAQVFATPAPTGVSASSHPQAGPDDGGLAAGYPDLGYGLTRRQHQILGLVLAGHPSKNIAADLGISRRTVESHRAAIMQRTGATSLPALARLAIGADVGGDCKALAGS